MTNLAKTVDLIETDQLSKEQKKAIDLVIKKGYNLFIQGMAGTGKSAFIKYLQHNSNKNIVLCSPTAIAALNVGGMTLHSLFRLPIMDFITDDRLFKMNRKSVIDVIKAINILIIDEVSMVRPDILDAVDKVCRRIRGNYKPFGGIQVVLIGDLYQLPPIINKNTSNIFEIEYGSKDPFFFDANVYKKANFKAIQFTKVFRQLDKKLLDNLIRIRTATAIPEALKYFNNCKIKDKDTLEYAVTLTPYRNIASSINKSRLDKLKGKETVYKAKLDGYFETADDSACPGLKVLSLKKGALVIFNKNDKAKAWINGSVGIVEDLQREYITVRVLQTGKTVIVGREDWESKEYNTVEEDTGLIDPETKKPIKNKKIVETVTGTFIQFPLQLGYGMTIHKAQGKTLDKVSIDLDRGAFAPGQLYVALSRTRTKEDMNVVNPIKPRDIIINDRIKEFLDTIKVAK